MNQFMQSLVFEVAIANQDLIARMEERMEEAKDRYWDAVKYPRKKKKSIRKEALNDYLFHSQMRDFTNHFKF